MGQHLVEVGSKTLENAAIHWRQAAVVCDHGCQHLCQLDEVDQVRRCEELRHSAAIGSEPESQSPDFQTNEVNGPAPTEQYGFGMMLDRNVQSNSSELIMNVDLC